MLSIFRLRIGCIHWRNKEGKLSYGETIKNHNSRKTGIKIPPSITDSESVTLWKSSMSSLALLQHSCFLQENVVCKQKNVVINRVSSPNVESLPHIKAFFFSPWKTSHMLVFLSHSNYLMLNSNKLGTFSKTWDAYFASSQINFNYKTMYCMHDCKGYWMQLFVSGNWKM